MKWETREERQEYETRDNDQQGSDIIRVMNDCIRVTRDKRPVMSDTVDKERQEMSDVKLEGV